MKANFHRKCPWKYTIHLYKKPWNATNNYTVFTSTYVVKHKKQRYSYRPTQTLQERYYEREQTLHIKSYISPELFILHYIKHSLIAIHSSTSNRKRIWDIAMTANRSIITLIGIDFILNSVSNWKSTRYWFSYCCLIYEIKGTVLDVGDVQTTPNFSSGYCLDWPISLLLAKYVRSEGLPCSTGQKAITGIRARKNCDCQCCEK